MATANPSSKRLFWITLLFAILYATAFTVAFTLRGYAQSIILGLMIFNILYSVLYFINEFRYDRVLSGRASITETEKIQRRRKFFTWYWVVLVNIAQIFVFAFLFQALHSEDYFRYAFGNKLNYFDWVLFSIDCVFKSVLDIPEIFGWHLRNIEAIHWISQSFVAVVRLLIYSLLVAALLRQWKRWMLLKETIAAMNTAPQMAGRRLVRMGEDALQFVDDTMLKPQVFNPEPEETDRLQRDEHSEPLLQMLLRNLSAGNANEKENSAVLIGLLALEDQSSHPYFGELVSAAKSETEPSVRREIVRTLGKLEDQRTFFAIRRFLQDTDAEVRYLAARALGKVEDSRGIHALALALKEEQENKVKIGVIRALGRIGHKSARSTLLEAMNDPETEVQVEAVFSLAHLFEESIAPRLLQLLEHNDGKVRRKAVECIQKVQPPGVEQTLFPLLQDEEAFVRLAATEVLGELNPKLACDAILQANEQEPLVLRAQVAILREYKEDRFEPFFVQCTLHEDGFVRERAIAALGAFNSDATVEELVKVMNNSYIDDTMHAIRALGNTRNPNAYSHLYDVASNPKTPEHLRRQAQRSLQMIDPQRAKNDMATMKVTNS